MKLAFLHHLLEDFVTGGEIERAVVTLLNFKTVFVYCPSLAVVFQHIIFAATKARKDF